MVNVTFTLGQVLQLVLLQGRKAGWNDWVHDESCEDIITTEGKEVCR
jgi:hypothetical protein